MSPLQTARGVFTLCLAPILTFIVSLLALIDMLWVRRSEWQAQQFPRWWGRAICRLAGVQVRVEGLEHIDPKQTYIFAGNHASQFDIFTFQGYFPYDFRWLAKKELFRLPVFGWAMHRVGYIPVDRSNSRDAMKSLDAAAARIAKGKSVLIFPEGTRSPDGHLKAFKAGAVLLAIKAGVAIVPMGFNGSFQVLPKGRWLPAAGEIVLRIGPPIVTTGCRPKDKQKLAGELHEAVAALLDEAHKPLPDDAGPEPAQPQQA